MKQYDYLKAKRYIDENREKILYASLGMDEDWWWTAETVFKNGEFVINLQEKELEIAGISGSSWATPTLEIVFKDGTSEKFNCYVGESDAKSPPYPLGCISTAVAENRALIERKEIE